MTICKIAHNVCYQSSIEDNFFVINNKAKVVYIRLLNSTVGVRRHSVLKCYRCTKHQLMRWLEHGRQKNKRVSH